MMILPVPSTRTTRAMAHFLLPVPHNRAAANPPGNTLFTYASRSRLSLSSTAAAAVAQIRRGPALLLALDEDALSGANLKLGLKLIPFCAENRDPNEATVSFDVPASCNEASDDARDAIVAIALRCPRSSLHAVHGSCQGERKPWRKDTWTEIPRNGHVNS